MLTCLPRVSLMLTLINIGDLWHAFSCGFSSGFCMEIVLCWSCWLAGIVYGLFRCCLFWRHSETCTRWHPVPRGTAHALLSWVEGGKAVLLSGTWWCIGEVVCFEERLWRSNRVCVQFRRCVCESKSVNIRRGCGWFVVMYGGFIYFEIYSFEKNKNAILIKTVYLI